MAIIKNSTNYRDFPADAVVKNLPCKAGDMDSIPGWRTKIPCATRPLSPGAQLLNPRAQESVRHSEGSCTMQQGPHVLQLRPDAAKYINKYFLKKVYGDDRGWDG